MVTSTSCLVLLTLLVSAHADIPLGCRDGSCYQLMRATMTWNDSRDDCLSQGGDLAVIKDEATQDFLAAALFAQGPNLEPAAANVWMGAKAVTTDIFYWEDGSPEVYDRWTTGYPGDKQFVAEFNSSGYHWQDRESPYQFRYLCDGTPGLCSSVPTDYILIQPSASVTCVLAYVGSSTFSWYNAQSECASLGTILATVNSGNIFNAIQTELMKPENQYEAYWIGLHKEVWSWVDGVLVGYNNWAASTPAGEECMNMFHACDPDCGKYPWHDDPCNNTKAYVCELPHITTVGPPTVTTDPGEETTTGGRTYSTAGTTEVVTTPLSTGSVATQSETSESTPQSTSSGSSVPSTPVPSLGTGTITTVPVGTGSVPTVSVGTGSVPTVTVGTGSIATTSGSSPTISMGTGSIPTTWLPSLDTVSTPSQGEQSTSTVYNPGTASYPTTPSTLVPPTTSGHTIDHSSTTIDPSAPTNDPNTPTQDPSASTKHPDDPTQDPSASTKSPSGPTANPNDPTQEVSLPSGHSWDTTSDSVTDDNGTSLPIISNASGLTGGQIAGICVGCVAGVALVAFLAFVMYKKRSTKDPETGYSVYDGNATIERYSVANGKGPDDYSFVNPMYDDDMKSLSSDSVISPNNNVVDFNPIYATAVKPMMNTNTKSLFDDVGSKLQTPVGDVTSTEAPPAAPDVDDDIQSLPSTDAVQDFMDDYDDEVVTSPNRTVVSVTSEGHVDQPNIESLEDESVFVTTIVLP